MKHNERMTERYIAFDVETPNHRNDRMSAIGIAVVENGAVTEEFSALIDPEAEFDWFNMQLTGITPEAVDGAPPEGSSGADVPDALADAGGIFLLGPSHRAQRAVRYERAGKVPARVRDRLEARGGIRLHGADGPRVLSVSAES